MQQQTDVSAQTQNEAAFCDVGKSERCSFNKRIGNFQFFSVLLHNQEKKKDSCERDVNLRGKQYVGNIPSPLYTSLYTGSQFHLILSHPMRAASKRCQSDWVKPT